MYEKRRLGIDIKVDMKGVLQESIVTYQMDSGIVTIILKEM